MILLIAPSNDLSALELCDRFFHHNIQYLRVSEQTMVYSIFIDVKNDIFILGCKDEIGTFEIKYSNIKFLIYRSGKFRFSYNVEINGLLNDFKKELLRFLKRELNSVNEYLFHKLFQKPHIGVSPLNKLARNKLVTLDLAKKIGIKTADTIIIDDLSKNKGYNNNQFISKSITDIVRLYTNNKILISKGVEGLSNHNIKTKIFPSLVQKRIIKKFDVKVIFIHGLFFPVGIKTLKNSNGDIDYRKYLLTDNLTYFSIVSPQRLKIKLLKMVKGLRINWGIIDFIVDKQNEFYFNIYRTIQFRMPCNSINPI